MQRVRAQQRARLLFRRFSTTTAIVVVVACNSGPNLATAARIDERDVGPDPGPDEGASISAPPSFPSKPPPPNLAEGGPAGVPIPVVACSSNDIPDAGADAEVPKSPCDTPPPSTCATRTERVEWLPGPCVNDRCVFSQYVTSCPKGCFRQVDGGEGCAR